MHQVALDQQDRVLGFMSKLSEEDALLFSRLYAEEMDALNASQTEENERMMRENTAIAQSAAPAATGQLTTWVALAAFFAAVVALIKIMK